VNPDPTSLDRLHDVIAPLPTPWWPPAPGWYWVMAIVIALACYAAIRIVIWWQRDRYRREALAEWRRQSVLLGDATTRIDGLAQLSILLKRTALSAFQRERVASLTGTQWRAFLDQTSAMTAFASERGSTLEHAAYGDLSAVDLSEANARDAAQLVRKWIVNHRVDPPEGRG
jgi:hypothetical protein